MNKYVITVAVRNAENYIERALDSAINQNYPDYRIVVRDDASTDNTWPILLDYIRKKSKGNMSIARNSYRRGVVGNHYTMSQSIDDDSIIVILDGDDQLAHENVLNVLDQYYDDPDTWITYGSFGYDEESRNPAPGADWRGFAGPLGQHTRHDAFSCTHLRTYRSWLFKNIRTEDLMYEGDFYQLICDHVTMYPMIEMAGPKHSRYIHDILYLYNAANPYNEHKIDISEKPVTEDIDYMVNYFKSLPIYERLD